MDSKLIVILIVCVILGTGIVVTGCIKVLGKNGSLDMKAALFILVGFVFVCLPVATSIGIEWGDFKLFVNTTSKQVEKMQKTLDSLSVVNSDLSQQLARLNTDLNNYRQMASDPHVSPIQRARALQEISSSLVEIDTKVNNLGASIRSTVNKNNDLQKETVKFKSKSWFRN
ncbi:MAG: hypothetical protein U0X39_01535 [Bacteroidales bacterium]